MTNHNTPTHEAPLPVKIRIDADVQVREDFANDPYDYIARNQILSAVSQEAINPLLKSGDLLSHVDLLEAPEKSLVVNLFRMGAIVLHVNYKANRPTLYKIEMDVGLLLYNDSDYPVVQSEVQAAYSLLIEGAAPLLNDPLRDCIRLVPGLAPGILRGVARGFGRSLARKLDPGEAPHPFVYDVKTKLILPGVNPKEIHKPEIMDFSMFDEVIYSIKPYHDEGANSVESEVQEAIDQFDEKLIREAECSCLYARFLFPHFNDFGQNSSISYDVKHSALSSIFNRFVQSLEAVYMPAPDSISGERELAKVGRAIAMYSGLGNDEQILMQIFDVVTKQRAKASKDLRKFVQDEKSRIEPVPFSKLVESAIIKNSARRIHDFDWPIHPLIALAVAEEL